jgi:hypothetical protein
MLAGLVFVGEGRPQPPPHQHPDKQDEQKHKDKQPRPKNPKHADKEPGQGQQHDKQTKDKAADPVPSKSGAKQVKPDGKGAEKPARGKSADKQAGKAAAEVPEAAKLVRAYVLMAGANHDYDGHRAKAMHQVATALRHIDEHLVKHGGKAEHAAAAEAEAVKAAATAAARKTATVHENQQLSDQQMREAHGLIQQVNGDAARLKQIGIHEHMAEATKHIQIALRIR